MDTPDAVTKFLSKAEEVRMVAEAMQDTDRKHMLLAIAYGYDVLAVHSAYLAELLQNRRNPTPR